MTILTTNEHTIKHNDFILIKGIRAFKKKDTYKNDMLRATLVIKDPFDNGYYVLFINHNILLLLL